MCVCVQVRTCYTKSANNNPTINEGTFEKHLRVRQTVNYVYNDYNQKRIGNDIFDPEKSIVLAYNIVVLEDNERFVLPF